MQLTLGGKLVDAEDGRHVLGGDELLLVLAIAQGMESFNRLLHVRLLVGFNVYVTPFLRPAREHGVRLSCRQLGPA